MTLSLKQKKEELKLAIAASMLLDSAQLDRIFVLIDGMNLKSLENTKKHFAVAKAKRDNLLTKLFAKDKKAVKAMDKTVESVEKFFKVRRIGEFGREVLKSTIKKK